MPHAVVSAPRHRLDDIAEFLERLGYAVRRELAERVFVCLDDRVFWYGDPGCGFSVISFEPIARLVAGLPVSDDVLTHVAAMSVPPDLSALLDERIFVEVHFHPLDPLACAFVVRVAVLCLKSRAKLVVVNMMDYPDLARFSELGEPVVCVSAGAPFRSSEPAVVGVVEFEELMERVRGTLEKLRAEREEIERLLL